MGFIWIRLLRGTVLTEIWSTEVRDSIAQVAEDPSILKKWAEDATPKMLSSLVQILIAIAILLIGLRVISFVVKIIQRSFGRSNMETGVATFLASLVRYVLLFFLIMLILGQFGVTTGSVVALLGSAGLTMGLALQGSLSNFAGGVLILMLKPFIVGDYINAGSVEGTVQEITIFYTKLTTIDNKAIVIPNGSLSNTTITNFSHMETRMIAIRVGVDYGADLEVVKTALSDVVCGESRVLEDRPVQIFVAELAESSVEMEVRVWTRNEDYWPVRWALTENVKKMLDERGINIPYPHVEIVGKGFETGSAGGMKRL